MTAVVSEELHEQILGPAEGVQRLIMLTLDAHLDHAEFVEGSGKFFLIIEVVGLRGKQVFPQCDGLLKLFDGLTRRADLFGDLGDASMRRR